jgi:hypothetical protein
MIKDMVGYIYLVVIASIFIFIWIRHYYLIHFKMNSYMSAKYSTQWNEMKRDTGWYRPAWATLYYTKAIYDFIWRSEESYDDDNIISLRKEIKRFIWELPLFFVSVIFLSFCFVWFGWL